MGTPISGLALTNYTLVVVSSKTILAWQLTEGGMVKGVSGDRRAGRVDSIWIITPQAFIPPEFFVEGQIGFIKLLASVFSYCLRTGQEYGYTSKPPPPLPHRSLKDTSRGRYHIRYSKPSLQDDLSEDNLPVSQPAFQEKWVKDPEGKHQLWLPVEWRAAVGCVEWSHYIPTLQFELPGEFIAIAFYLGSSPL